VFGDVALLFNSSRTASVVAKDNITVWALDRKTFLQFVMKHAQGARALRFLRKLPLLKGLSDTDLMRAAARMPQRVYQDGQALIKYGERGDELFLIRYGKVRQLGARWGAPAYMGKQIFVGVMHYRQGQLGMSMTIACKAGLMHSTPSCSLFPRRCACCARTDKAA
jgi:hypothetical protein